MSSIDRGKGNDTVKGTGTGGAAESVYEGRAGLLLTSIALAPVDCPPGPGPWSDDEGEGEFHSPLLTVDQPRLAPMTGLAAWARWVCRTSNRATRARAKTRARLSDD